MGDRRGLTMIEMLVVVAVLAAITALAYPSLEGWAERERVNHSLAEIGAGVAAGRARARESGKPVEVTLSSGLAPAKGGRESADVAALEAVGIALPNGISAFRASEAKEDSSPAKPVVLAVCLPDGTVESAGAASLVCKQRTIDLAVSRWTGAVRGTERALPAAGSRDPKAGAAPGTGGAL